MSSWQAVRRYAGAVGPDEKMFKLRGEGTMVPAYERPAIAAGRRRRSRYDWKNCSKVGPSMIMAASNRRTRS